MRQPEYNNLLGYASCWTQQLACLIYGLFIPACVEVDGNVNTQLAESNNLHTQASCWIQVDTFILL